MAIERLMLAVGRLERALSKLEMAPLQNGSADDELRERHDRLKQETRAAIAEIDNLLAGAR